MVMETAAKRDGHADDGNGQNVTHLSVLPDFTRPSLTAAGLKE
jgi:hypothetical protein